MIEVFLVAILFLSVSFLCVSIGIAALRSRL